MKTLILFTILPVLLSFSSALDFYVGGKDGWVQNPKESYDHWAGRLRFQINDRLVFKYNKSEDSVLVVNKQDYASCNIKNPIQKLEGGDSVFQFNRSGPFYFISGVADRCAKNQKLIVVVLAERRKKPVSPSPSPSPSPPPSPLTPSIRPPPSKSPSSDQGGGSTTPAVVTPPSTSGASMLNIWKVGIVTVAFVFGHIIVG